MKVLDVSFIAFLAAIGILIPTVVLVEATSIWLGSSLYRAGIVVYLVSIVTLLLCYGHISILAQQAEKEEMKTRRMDE